MRMHIVQTRHCKLTLQIDYRHIVPGKATRDSLVTYIKEFTVLNCDVATPRLIAVTRVYTTVSNNEIGRLLHAMVLVARTVVVLKLCAERLLVDFPRGC